jgi:hypothetical protein
VRDNWYHCIWILLLGYLIGYYWRGLGNATVARLMPSGG